MKLTLADLELEYRHIYDELESNGGDLTEELQDALAINDSDFEDRVENYHLMITQNDSDTERLNRVIKNAKAKIEAKTKVSAYLEEIIKKAAKTIILPEKTKGGLLTYKKEFRDIRLVISPSQSVNITNLEAVKEAGLGKYGVDFNTNDEIIIQRIRKAFPNIEIKAEFSPDKTEITKKLKAGEDIKGAELETNYKSVKFN